MYKRIFIKYYILLFLFIVFISRLVFAAESKIETTIVMDSKQTENKLIVNYTDGLLSIEVKSISTKILFEAISKKTGIESIVDSVIKDMVTIKFENMKLKEGLEKIINSIGNGNYGLVYKKGEKGEWELNKIYLIKRSAGVEDNKMTEILDNIDIVAGRKKGNRSESVKTLEKTGKNAIPKLAEALDNEETDLLDGSLSQENANKHLFAKEKIVEILSDIDDENVIPIIENEYKKWEGIYIPKYSVENPSVQASGNIIRIKLNQTKEKFEIRDNLGLKDKTLEENINILVNSLDNAQYVDVVQNELENLGEPSLNELYKIINDIAKQKKLRENALLPLIKILNQLNRKAERLDLLIKLVNEEANNDNSIKVKALEYLSNSVIEPKDYHNQIMDTLLNTLKSFKNSDVIRFAGTGLYNAKNEKALPILIEYFKDNDDNISSAAERILHNYYKDNPEFIIENIRNIINTSDLMNKKRAIYFLEKVGGEAAISILKDASNDPEIKDIVETVLLKIKGK